MNFFQSAQRLVYFITAGMFVVPVVAQEQQIPEDEIILVGRQQGDIRIVEAENAGQQAIQNFDLPDTLSASTDTVELVRDSDLDASNNLLYVISGGDSYTTTTPHPGRLEQINLEQRTSRVIYEHSGLMEMYLSPSGTQAVLRYYEDEMGGIMRACILGIATGSCLDIASPIGLNDVSWVDDEAFIFHVHAERTRYLVNASNAQMSPLSGLDNWYVEVATAIPNTRELLIAATSMRTNGIIDANRLLIYNLDNFSIRPASFQPSTLDYTTSLDYLQIYRLSVSPDGRYFAMTSARSIPKLTVVNFETGEIVSILEGIVVADWYSEGSQLLAVTGSQATYPSVQVTRVDAATESSTLVATLPDFAYALAP